VNRTELVDFLRQRYNAEGYAGIREIIQYMRDHGQLHDPEWFTCSHCGREWERGFGQHAWTTRCDYCNQRLLGQTNHRARKPVAEARGTDHRTAKQRRLDGGVATPADRVYGDDRQPDLIG
jgi:DNA-directed RNA polymerase subunit RPC12/RpoP